MHVQGKNLNVKQLMLVGGKKPVHTWVLLFKLLTTIKNDWNHSSFMTVFIAAISHILAADIGKSFRNSQPANFTRYERVA